MASEIFSGIESETSKLLDRIRSGPTSLSGVEDITENLKRIKAFLYEAEEWVIGDEDMFRYLQRIKFEVSEVEDVVDESRYKLLQAQVENQYSRAEGYSKTKAGQVSSLDYPYTILRDWIWSIREFLKHENPRRFGLMEKKSLDHTKSGKPVSCTLSITDNLLIPTSQSTSSTSSNPTNTDKKLEQGIQTGFTGLDFTDPFDNSKIQKPLLLGEVGKKSLHLTNWSTSEEWEVPLLVEDGKRWFHRGHLVIYGRDNDKENMINLLLHEDGRSRNKLSVIPIIGSGGVGKTTLAKLVYNDPMVCQYFSARGWVHVSDSSDLVKLSNAIVSSITGKSCDGKEPSHLQAILREELVGRRLLLVLDDVEKENPSLWESLLSLLSGVRIGKIIVASREEGAAANIMQVIPPYHLACLTPNFSWDLFSLYAFNGLVANPPAELIEIGRKIVVKCKGLPLAVKTLGCLLNFQTNGQIWIDVLESTLWERESEILPALELSYYLMPNHLKPCFIHCSMFPRGYEFDKYEFVRLWMAQDFIEPKGSKRLEDIGCEYFYELQRMSFFDESWDGTFTMHDLLHDLSKSISKGECSAIEDLELNPGKNYWEPHDFFNNKVRHLYVTSRKPIYRCHSSEIPTAMALRTFVYRSLYGGLPDWPSTPSNMTGDSAILEVSQVTKRSFHKVKRSRSKWPSTPLHMTGDSEILELTERSLDEGPPFDLPLNTLHMLCDPKILEQIELEGNQIMSPCLGEKKVERLSLLNYAIFICLRYLRIYDKSIESLPTSVCRLYNLQAMILDKCLNLRELPSDIGNLVNLRYLGLSEVSIQMLPESVCQLFHLESLILNYCKNLSELPSDIGNLVNLHYVGLSGTNTKGLPESVCKLAKLPILKLDYCKILVELPSSIGDLINLHSIGATHTKIKRLPESVCHLSNLLILDLADSNLLELPSGIGNLSKLCYFGLSHTNINVLPESFCQLSSLHTLKLNGCTNLSHLPNGIGILTNLRHLILSSTDIGELPESLCQLSNLQTLQLDGCKRYFNLPSGIGDLTKLCHLNLSDTEIGELPASIYQLSNLQMLEMNGCHRLSQLPDGIGELSNLHELAVTETKIRELPKSFCQLSKLKRLNLNGNWNLQNFPSGIENLTNLCHLELSEVGIQVLPKHIGQLTKLEMLIFEYKQNPIESSQ